MQLGMLNSMLRGLPMQQATTSIYQAPPSTAATLGSLGVAGLGASQLMKSAGSKKGGVIKAAGGIPMRMYSPEQLQQVQQSPNATPLAKSYGAGLQQIDNRIQANPQAKQILAQPLPLPQVPPTNIPNETINPMARSGVASIATPPGLTQMAGGGIVAFADEGLVQDKNSDEYLKSVNNQVLAKGLQDYLSGANKATEAIKPDIEAEKASIQADKDRQLGMALLEGGFRGLQNLSPYAAVGLGRLGEGVVGSYAKQGKDISGAEQIGRAHV